MSQTESKGRVLIVDDSLTMRRVLSSMLATHGYEVFQEAEGPAAIARAQEVPPDIFLVDVEMPNMDGFELCAALKRLPDLCDIPVIFISALSDRFDKIRAFGVGAADYVTKPFDLDEVQARIQAHVQLRRLHLQQEQQNARLLAQNEQMKELEQQRDDLTRMIVHDLRTPLTCVHGFLRLLDLRGKPLLPPDLHESIDLSLAATHELIELVTSLLDISKLEAGAMQIDRAPCDLATLTAEVLARTEALRERRALVVAPVLGGAEVMGDAGLLRRVLANMVSNAIRLTSPDDGRIEVSFESHGDEIRVRVADNGPGIAPEWHARIFEKFAQAGSRSTQTPRTTGLGLTFCKLAVEAHGGRIGLDSALGEGTTFWFDLPRGATQRPQETTAAAAQA